VRSKPSQHEERKKRGRKMNLFLPTASDGEERRKKGKRGVPLSTHPIGGRSQVENNSKGKIKAHFDPEKKKECAATALDCPGEKRGEEKEIAFFQSKKRP